jgi:hypothetical protein
MSLFFFGNFNGVNPAKSFLFDKISKNQRVIVGMKFVYKTNAWSTYNLTREAQVSLKQRFIYRLCINKLIPTQGEIAHCGVYSSVCKGITL